MNPQAARLHAVLVKVREALNEARPARTVDLYPEEKALLAPYFELIEDEAVHDSIAVFAGGERWLTWRRCA